MKKLTKNVQLAGLLSLALFFGLGYAPFASAQDKARQRVITSPTPTPTATPAPIPTPTAVPTPASVQTLADLQAKIRLSLSRPELRRGQVGVKIVSLDTGKVVYDENSEKYFMPASNMKNFTVAAALARLTPDFRFVTSVYAPAMPDANGTIKGDLTIYGRGDPSISTAFNNGDYYKGMNALVEKIVAAGVKRVEGNLVGDESYFNTDPVPSTWEWDDLLWYYGAEVSALTVNDNSLDVSVISGANAGAIAPVTISPNPYGLVLVNRVVTGSANSKRDINIYRKLGSNILEVSGNLPLGDKYQSSVAAVRPANVFVSMLRQLLEQKGVVITGQTRAVSFREKMPKSFSPEPASAQPVEIAKLESVPFSEIAAKTLKPSQNLYTELILRALGEAVGDKSNSNETSESRGLKVVQAFLNEAGIAPGSVLQYDGCGLSRHDLITPAAAVQLYDFMNRHAYSQAWHESLTVGGVDGTLKNRFKNTLAENNVHGKTGTIDQVSSLSGYIKTAGRERLIFSILTNGIPGGKVRTDTIDDIVIALANFNGTTN